MAIDLVGTYQVIDPADPFWMDDPSVDHTYTYALSAFIEYVGATMLLAPDAYPGPDDHDAALGPADDLPLAVVRRSVEVRVERAR